MSKELDKWLDKRVKGAVSKYDYYDGILESYHSDNLSMDDYNRYYVMDDIDIKHNSLIMQRILDHETDSPTGVNLSYYKEEYKDNNILKHELMIPPNTNHKHSQFLFKSLVDCSKRENMIHMKSYLIDKTMKESFYKFCKDNS